MSGGVGEGSQCARPGPSSVAIASDASEWPTGVPVVDLAAAIGPVGETYDEEFGRLKKHLTANGDLLGPMAPVIYIDAARSLYDHARKIVADATVTPYNKCALLFQIFDAIVLVFKNLSFVYCDNSGVRSVYGYSDLALKTVLARIEAIARQVAVGVHDTYSLSVLNRVVASTEQRLSQVRTDRDMVEFFRGVTSDGWATTGTADLPAGVERYEDPFPEAAALLRRLYATNSDKDYVREFHDTVFLIATSNAPATLSGALETRLADKDRNVVLFEAPGDRMFATSMCASAIALLREKLAGDGSAPGEIETYRINYGRVFNKFHGQSERNFDDLMEWIKRKVRASDRFRVFWFPDIENLMAPRSSQDKEHIAAIKNAMLQHMDVFNKDRTLRSFLLLFHSSEGPLDGAFSRRLETVVKTPPDPLSDTTVALEIVGAELARYHINLTDELAARVAVQAGTFDPRSSRIGGFAHVQATLRDMYVNQKLMLRYDARAVEAEGLPSEVADTAMGRYLAIGSLDKLYDLDETPVPFADVGAFAFGPASRAFAKTPAATAFKYNANIRGDPKDVGVRRTVSKIVFLHDV